MPVADVIIVEDDQGFVEMLRFALEKKELTVEHYADGALAYEALRQLDLEGRRPVLLLDVDLPGLDGLTLQERLHAERPQAFRTVFLTGRASEAEQLRGFRAGAWDYVPKPVNLLVLVAKLVAWRGTSSR